MGLMKHTEPPESGQKKRELMAKMFSFTTEFAVVLAAPLIILIYLGKYLDQRLDTHYIVIIGIFVALIISSTWIYRRLKSLNDQLSKK